MAADRRAPRRVGIRRHGRVRLLRHQSAPPVPPRRRVDAPMPRRPRSVPASTSSCQAPTATASRCVTRSTPASSRWQTSTRPSVGHWPRSSASACSNIPTSMPIGCSVDTRSPAQIELARDVARDSLVLLRNDGVLPLDCASFGRRHRPERGERTERPRRLQLSGPRRVAARSAEEWPQRVRHAARPRRRRRRGERHVPRRCRARRTPRPPRHRARSATRRAARSTTTTARASTTAVAAAAASDVAILVMGDRSGLTDDCTTGESRDVVVARSARRAGGTRAGGRRDRHADRARADRRTADRFGAGARRGERGADGVAARRAGCGGDRRCR